MANDTSDRHELLQCLTTEHFVLQTARAATIQEANQRANLFLTSVSSATLALAFVAQVTHMGGPFLLFSLLLLPCVFFIGLVTFVREVQIAIEDMVHARGMARIRHYFACHAPAIRPYLIHSTHDDESAVRVDRGLRPAPLQYFMTSAGMVGTIDGVIAGVFIGIAARAVDWELPVSIASGSLAFAAAIVLMRHYHVRAWAAAERGLAMRFPADAVS